MGGVDRARQVRSTEGRLNQAALVWDPRLANYDLGDGHPLNPIRLVLAARLMESLGLLGAGGVLEPTEASEGQLRLVHSAGYIEAVRHAECTSRSWSSLASVGASTLPGPSSPSDSMRLAASTSRIGFSGCPSPRS